MQTIPSTDTKVKPAGRHPLVVAQYLRLRAQIPPLYGLLSVNAAILAFTHRSLAPPLLALVIPSLLIGLSLVRMVQWLQPMKPEDFEPRLIAQRMRRTTIYALVFAIAFVIWSFAIDQYGGPLEHGHVANFVGITLLGCVFCLSFLPRAAVIVCATVCVASLGYSIYIGNEILMAIAVNLTLVAGVILMTLRDSFRAFVDLEVSQRALSNERRQAQILGEQNAALAKTDALTGLPNRRHFLAKLEDLLFHASPEDRFCVGLIDLDRFKPVNDTYGHAMGDRLLATLGRRMVEACPPEAFIARIGGDEFGLIVPGELDLAERLARQLAKEICKPALLGEVLVSVGCSSGLAAFPDTATSANRLYDRADFALYHAKNHRRGQCVRFSEELEALILSEQAFDAALQAADIDTEISLAYQPIVSTGDLGMIGVECLARWHSPTLGTVPPEQLIATAERLGRAQAVTLALFDRVLNALRQLPAHLRLSFNLSGQDLCHPPTIAGILERIEKAGCTPSRLVFEITETSLIADLETAKTALGTLRRTGAKIALDDFGTGYSSLSSLHQLPLDMVKIDRSFAWRLDEAAGRRLVTAIRNLARSLNLECVIEGIETENQLISARLAGFPLAQGYFIARPMSLHELQTFQSRGPSAELTHLAQGVGLG